MRIVAIARHVPDSRVPVRLRADGAGVETEGLKHVCNPFDEIGLEVAVQLKAQRSDVEEVVVMTVGPAGAVETLRHGLAMGADRAVHVVDEGIRHFQEFRSAALCAAAIQRTASPWGLILCGTRSTENGAGEFGPALAEILDAAHTGSVTRLDLNDDGRNARAHSRIEGGEMVIDTSTPLVASCERGLAEPRHPALPKIMKAKKQPIETLDAGALGEVAAPDASLMRMTAPPARAVCRMIDGDPAQMAREIVRLLRDEARAL